MKRTLAALLMPVLALSLHAGAVGQWTAYLAYRDITDIEPAGRMVYVLSSNDLFSYNTSDRSVTAYNKMNSLSGSQISFIGWCESARKLVVVYADNTIDLLDSDGKTTTIGEYASKSLTEDKTIRQLSIGGKYAYLATGFGVLKVDVEAETISNTYQLGKAVASVAAVDQRLFVLEADGRHILEGNMATDNLLDKTNWKRHECDETGALHATGGRLLAVRTNDVATLDLADGQLTPTRVVVIDGATTYGQHLNGQQLVLCRGGQSYVTDGVSTKYYKTPDAQAMAYDAANRCFWANDAEQNLTALTTADDGTLEVSLRGICPDGPKYNHFFCTKFHNNRLYATGGGITFGVFLSRPGFVQRLEDGEWKVYADNVVSVTGRGCDDVCDICFDPNDPAHSYIASSHTGIYELRGDSIVQNWTDTNSPLKVANTLSGYDPYYVLATGAAFDSAGNLWVLNSWSESALLELQPDGQWTDHTGSQLRTHAKAFRTGHLRSPMFDSRGLLWFCNDHWSLPALVSYDPQSGQTTLYTDFINQDGTDVSPASGVAAGVRCVAEDLEKNIWIGTNVGPLMLQATDIAQENNTFTQVKVPRNDGTNLADYLLSGVSISSMAVDAANRKWFGTYGNGVYLISSDNIEEVEHFTTENSQLLSDVVESIAIDHRTGEVFFGTDQGLCSYFSDATTSQDVMEKDNVYAYPNPVRPDYTGLITITGLSADADVKISTSHGTLVAQGRSNGGTFTWDGCDLKGRRVASGVYMVMAATSDGKKGVVCKVAIVR